MPWDKKHIQALRSLLDLRKNPQIGDAKARAQIGTSAGVGLGEDDEGVTIEDPVFVVMFEVYEDESAGNHASSSLEITSYQFAAYMSGAGSLQKVDYLGKHETWTSSRTRTNDPLCGPYFVGGSDLSDPITAGYFAVGGEECANDYDLNNRYSGYIERGIFQGGAQILSLPISRVGGIVFVNNTFVAVSYTVSTSLSWYRYNTTTESWDSFSVSTGLSGVNDYITGVQWTSDGAGGFYGVTYASAQFYAELRSKAEIFLHVDADGELTIISASLSGESSDYTNEALRDETITTCTFLGSTVDCASWPPALQDGDNSRTKTVEYFYNQAKFETSKATNYRATYDENGNLVTAKTQGGQNDIKRIHEYQHEEWEIFYDEENQETTVNIYTINEDDSTLDNEYFIDYGTVGDLDLGENGLFISDNQGLKRISYTKELDDGIQTYCTCHYNDSDYYFKTIFHHSIDPEYSVAVRSEYYQSSITDSSPECALACLGETPTYTTTEDIGINIYLYYNGGKTELGFNTTGWRQQRWEVYTSAGPMPPSLLDVDFGGTEGMQQYAKIPDAVASYDANVPYTGYVQGGHEGRIYSYPKAMKNLLFYSGGVWGGDIITTGLPSEYDPTGKRGYSWGVMGANSARFADVFDTILNNSVVVSNAGSQSTLRFLGVSAYRGTVPE